VGSARIGPRMMAASRTCVCFGPGHGLTPRTPMSSPITALPTKPHALLIGTLSPSGCRCEPQLSEGEPQSNQAVSAFFRCIRLSHSSSIASRPTPVSNAVQSQAELQHRRLLRMLYMIPGANARPTTAHRPPSPEARVIACGSLSAQTAFHEDESRQVSISSKSKLWIDSALASTEPFCLGSDG
jgi:hypothetical protein